MFEGEQLRVYSELDAWASHDFNIFIRKLVDIYRDKDLPYYYQVVVAKEIKRHRVTQIGRENAKTKMVSYSCK